MGMCNFKKKLDAIKKSAKNWSKDKKDQLNKAIDQAGKAMGDAVDGQVSALNDIVNMLKEMIKASAEAQAIAAKNEKKQAIDHQAAKDHNMQDAKKDFKHERPDHLNKSPKYATSVKPMDPATYSNAQDYPAKRGHIDEMNNYWCHNHKTGEWWRVHHTGYYQKVDGKGNYEEKIPGTAFYYTMGDIHFSYCKNIDKIIKENRYTHILGEETKDIDKDKYLNIGKNYFKKTALNDKEKIGKSKFIKTGMHVNVDAAGNITIKAAGNIKIEAGGQITIKGAKVNIN